MEPIMAPAAGAVYFLIFLLGLSAGGFLNVVIYRLPREGLTLSKPGRSFCPACGAPLRWLDAIPVLGWLWLRARCRDCGKPISARYPLVELASGFLGLYLYHRFGFSATFLFQFYFVMCLLAIAWIDLEWMIIPRVLVYPTTVLGLAGAWLEPAVVLAGPGLWTWLEPIWGARWTALAGSLAGLILGWPLLALAAAAYRRIRGRHGLGEADAPLLGMIGVFLGWRAVPPVFLGAALIGLISAALLTVSDRNRSPKPDWGRRSLPFGPFLVLSAWLYLFFGPAFIAWYRALTG